MEKTLDLRGLMCPEPVLRTKKTLDDATVTKVECLVDDEINVNNLQRLARSIKASFQSRRENGSYTVTLDRSPHATKTQAEAHSHLATEDKAAPLSSQSGIGTVIFIGKEKLGEGDHDFSVNLLNVFLQTVFTSGQRPRAILMANTGVKIMAKQSPLLKVLQDFKDAGVDVLACGLCLEYYGLKDQIPTEQITNMFAISEYLFAADRVLSP